MNTLISYPLHASKTAIILNGEKDALALLKSNWQSYHSIIICDAAWDSIFNIFKQSAVANNIIVLGDGDSIKNRPTGFIQLNNENTTDFEKAIQWLMTHSNSNNIIDVDVFWATGGELDHTLGNLAVASKYAKNVTCHFYSEQQYYRSIKNNFCIKNMVGRTLSIFPYPKYLVKSSTGLKYLMKDYSMQIDTQQSLRNEILANEAVVTGLGNCFVFIQR